MNAKEYHYPSPIRAAKFQFKLVLALLPGLLIVIVLMRPYYQGSGTDYSVLLTAIPVLAAGCIYYLGSWCDLESSEEGIYVEFLWSELFVPWTEIVGVKRIGLGPIGYWVVGTNRKLTMFHYCYGIGAMPFLPSFHIHRSLERRRDLIARIESRMRQPHKAI